MSINMSLAADRGVVAHDADGADERAVINGLTAGRVLITDILRHDVEVQMGVVPPPSPAIKPPPLIWAFAVGVV